MCCFLKPVTYTLQAGEPWPFQNTKSFPLGIKEIPTEQPSKDASHLILVKVPHDSSYPTTPELE